MVSNLYCRKIGHIIPCTNLVIARHLKNNNKLPSRSKDIACKIVDQAVPEVCEDTHLPDSSLDAARDIVKAYPEEPSSCCMAGCANCVWLDYAEKLSDYYKDGGDKAKEEILEKVTDSNIRAFLMHELRMRNLTS